MNYYAKCALICVGWCLLHPFAFVVPLGFLLGLVGEHIYHRLFDHTPCRQDGRRGDDDEHGGRA